MALKRDHVNAIQERYFYFDKISLRMHMPISLNEEACRFTVRAHIRYCSLS